MQERTHIEQINSGGNLAFLDLARKKPRKNSRTERINSGVQEDSKQGRETIARTAIRSTISKGGPKEKNLKIRTTKSGSGTSNLEELVQTHGML